MRIHAKADWDPEPKRLGPFSIYTNEHGVAYAIGAVVVIVLLLIGLFSDNYFSPIVLGSPAWRAHWDFAVLSQKHWGFQAAERLLWGSHSFRPRVCHLRLSPRRS
jgi:hypothetical protein